MFTLGDLEKDAAAILDIKADIRGEAAKYGEVTKVELYDKEEEGIMFVRFTEVAAAKRYVKVN